MRVSDDGVEVLGFLDQERFTEELLAAKALVAPSLGGESFGMVLTRALACATPVVASDIPGYRDVMTPETCLAFPAGDEHALVEAVEALLADEPRRRAMGAAGRVLAQEPLLVGCDRPPSHHDLRGGDRRRSRARGGRLVKLPHVRFPRSAAGRAHASASRCSRVVVALFIWRGPSFTAIGDAFALGRMASGSPWRSRSTSCRSSRARSRGRP